MLILSPSVATPEPSARQRTRTLKSTTRLMQTMILRIASDPLDGALIARPGIVQSRRESEAAHRCRRSRLANTGRRLRRRRLSLGPLGTSYAEAVGAVAARLWWLRRCRGHAEPAVLDGGLAAWRAFGGVVATRIP